MTGHTIKFLGRYKKMPSGVQWCDTFVKDVVVRTRLELSQQEIDADTLREDGTYFDLKGDQFILVILWTDCLPNPVTWSTLRQWDPDKLSYYRGIRGQQVRIEILNA